MPIQLLRCRPEHEGEVISAIREFSLANPEFTFAHGYRDGMPFAEYVTELEKMELGEVPEGWTPATFLFALLTCDFDNEGSIRTIERNGGVLENTVTDPSVPKPKRRYWIDLSSLG